METWKLEPSDMSLCCVVGVGVPPRPTFNVAAVHQGMEASRPAIETTMPIAR
jgi:hypothetical protein